MPFTLLSAIDVADGRLALGSATGPVPLDAHGGDPMAAVGAVVAAGVRWLHVVDLDRAWGGRAANLELLTTIARAHPDVRIQASGGIATAAAAREALAAGAHRVVLASAALADENTAIAAIADLGDAAIVGIEVEDGRIRGRGARTVDLDLMATLGVLHAAGARGFLVTAVARVGGLAGPDVELVRRVARTGRPTLAAGGIASLADLRAARDAGASGAVVGRAALDPHLDLAAAVAWAAA